MENHGVNLVLDENESMLLTSYIQELIDSTVQNIIENPESLFRDKNIDYINLLNSSINYCNNFNLFNTKELTLEKYVKNAVYTKIKSLFLSDVNNSRLRNLYYEIRQRELDPVGRYPEQYIIEIIDEEIKSINTIKNIK